MHIFERQNDQLMRKATRSTTSRFKTWIRTKIRTLILREERGTSCSSRISALRERLLSQQHFYPINQLVVSSLALVRFSGFARSSTADECALNRIDTLGTRNHDDSLLRLIDVWSCLSPMHIAWFLDRVCMKANKQINPTHRHTLGAEQRSQSSA